MKTPVLVSVEIVQQSQIFPCDGLSVQPVWSGVDRPNTGGYNVGNDIVLAKRLQKAIESGKIWIAPPVVETDVFGKTYVCVAPAFSMRRANSELEKLGF